MTGASITILLAATLVGAGGALAKPKPSDEIPQEVLENCDDQAMPYGAYGRIIRAATKDLTDLGIFAETDFRDVRIGFCGLQRVQGPVATTSCARDTILLDTKYAKKGQRLVLGATLAHEMKHYFQHREQKARFGEGYCFTAQYNENKARMEEDADKFGDDVAALLYIGRPIEVRNECPVTVSVYLEADRPKLTAPDSQGFIDVAPHSTASTPGRSASKFFKYYAQSEPHDGRRWVWRGATMAHKRIIDGKPYGLRRITLSNEHRSTGPFRLNISCPNE